MGFYVNYKMQSKMQLSREDDNVPSGRRVQSKLLCRSDRIRRRRRRPSFGGPERGSGLRLMASHAAVMGCCLETRRRFYFTSPFLHSTDGVRVRQHHYRKQCHSCWLEPWSNLQIPRQLCHLNIIYIYINIYVSL